MIHGMIHIDSNSTFLNRDLSVITILLSRKKETDHERLLVRFIRAYTNMKECSDAWCCESCKKFLEVPIKRRVGKG